MFLRSIQICFVYTFIGFSIEYMKYFQSIRKYFVCRRRDILLFGISLIDLLDICLFYFVYQNENLWSNKMNEFVFFFFFFVGLAKQWTMKGEKNRCNKCRNVACINQIRLVDDSICECAMQLNKNSYFASTFVSDIAFVCMCVWESCLHFHLRVNRQLK